MKFSLAGNSEATAAAVEEQGAVLTFKPGLRQDISSALRFLVIPGSTAVPPGRV